MTIKMKAKTIFLSVDAILLLYLAYQFLSFWLYPQADQIKMIYDFAILMGFEFIMVHSGVFMSIIGRSWKMWLIFILIYGLFAVTFNVFVNNNHIIILYCAVVLNRILSGMRVWHGNNEDKDVIEMTDDQASIVGSAIMNILIYFLLLIIICFCMNFIPKFGLTDDFLQAANYASVKKAGGILTDMPQVAMCFGTLYYLILVLVNIFSIMRSVESAERRTQRRERSDAIMRKIERKLEEQNHKRK